jgi:ATP-dependent RNA helicase DeaD
MIPNFSAPVSRALAELGFTELTEVQEQAVPIVLQGEDLIVQSQTGTGKTAAFAIPLLELVSPEKPFVQALVLVPTRELAIQVGNDFRKIGRHLHTRVLVAYGGVDIEPQMQKLGAGAQIVVGTPGRVLDLMARRALNLSRTGFFILDEADIMLAMGFIRDVEKIIAATPAKKQVLMFCVDFPEEVMSLAKKYMRYPQHVKLVMADKSAKGVSQYFYVAQSGRKLGSLLYLLRQLKPERALIFCRTKRRVDELTRQLNYNGVKAQEIRGDLTQAQRTRTMDAFKSGLVNILVATDVAARGIHVERISHVFNYELPHDINYYIHRIGRTGRMHEVGEAITLCYSDEMGTLGQIERLMGKTLEEKFLPQNTPAPKFPPESRERRGFRRVGRGYASKEKRFPPGFRTYNRYNESGGRSR